MTNSHAFMSSYIKNRFQCTKVNGFTSSKMKLTYGTAQGSILGPLLFILYVNDLFAEIENQRSVLMYADDTLLMNNGKTILVSITNSQRSLDIVSNSCIRNKMTINTGKTKFMIVTPSSKDYILPKELYIQDVKLSQVHVYEYLGVLIDDKLNMEAHIDKMCTDVQKKYGILRKIRRYVSEETALLIYKVMIRPHFDYGDYIVDSGTQNRIDELDRIQDKIVRTIEYENEVDKREDIDTLKTRYNSEKLCVRRKRSLLKIMFDQGWGNMSTPYISNFSYLIILLHFYHPPITL